MIGEGCYEKHMRRDAVTSNVTEQVYARVHRCTRDRACTCTMRTRIQAHVHSARARAHIRIRTCTSREAASHEATSAETSYSDNCYYRVTGLIRSIKCKGRRSKSYGYPCTIPRPSFRAFITLACPRVSPPLVSAGVRPGTSPSSRRNPCRIRIGKLRPARDCSQLRSRDEHSRSFAGAKHHPRRMKVR